MADEQLQASPDEPPFHLMEDIVERLKLLDYELHFTSFRPLSHTYFAVPGPNPNEQFFYFMSLASWIMSLLGHQWDAPSQMDDPNSSAASLFAALQQIGAPTAFGGWQKLKQGYGEPVCAVLHWLLMQIPIEFHPAVHGQDASLEEDAIVDEAAAEDDEDDMIDDIGAADMEEEEFYHGDKADTHTERAGKTPTFKPTIAPDVWRIELERVIPQLRMQIVSDPKEWRNRLVNTRSNLQTLEVLAPGATTTLERVADDLEKTLQALVKSEEKLNVQCEGEVNEFIRKQEVVQARQEEYSKNSEGINSLSNDLKRVNDQLARVKEKMDQRGQSMTDTSPLIKMKAALAKLRTEAKQLEIRIGVTSHTLVLKKMKGMYADDRKSAMQNDYNEDDDM